MKMPNNPGKYEVLIKQYFHSVLDVRAFSPSLIEVPPLWFKMEMNSVNYYDVLKRD